jgi:hypothetical protein
VGKRHYLKKQIRNQLINWGYKIDGEQFYFDDPGHWILTLRRQ